MDRAFLKGLDLEPDVIDTIMSEYGTNVQRMKEQADGLTATLSERDAELAKYADYDQLKANYETSQTQLTAMQEKYKNTLKTSAIEKEALKAGAIDPADVLAYTNRDALTIDENGAVTGVEDAVKALKENKPYLFGEGKNSATGMQHGDNPDVDSYKQVAAAMRRA